MPMTTEVTELPVSTRWLMVRPRRWETLELVASKAAFEQVHDLTKLIKSENPGKKLVLFGHSYGSFISQKLINRYSTEYDAAILSGSSLLVPGVLGAGGFNKKWDKEPNATGYEWLSRIRRLAKHLLLTH
ncbi:MAG: hypothetical protein EBQ79_04135 [Actinobacteria bacterium]|nr:hypothetical protein [Actinomycetota bacterium]